MQLKSPRFPTTDRFSIRRRLVQRYVRWLGEFYDQFGYFPQPKEEYSGSLLQILRNRRVEGKLILYSLWDAGFGKEGIRMLTGWPDGLPQVYPSSVFSAVYDFCMEEFKYE